MGWYDEAVKSVPDATYAVLWAINNDVMDGKLLSDEQVGRSLFAQHTGAACLLTISTDGQLSFMVEAEAAVFKVMRITERLRTKFKGVNILGFLASDMGPSMEQAKPELWGAAPKFIQDPQDPYGAVRGFAQSLGEDGFKTYYTDFLKRFINPEDDMKKMALLGLNMLRIPLPIEMFLEPGDVEDGGQQFMIRCYQVGIPVLDKLFDMGDKYSIGICLSNFDQISAPTSSLTGRERVRLHVQSIERMCARYSRRRSFVAVDLLNEGQYSVPMDVGDIRGSRSSGPWLLAFHETTISH